MISFYILFFLSLNLTRSSVLKFSSGMNVFIQKQIFNRFAHPRLNIPPPNAKCMRKALPNYVPRHSDYSVTL